MYNITYVRTNNIYYSKPARSKPKLFCQLLFNSFLHKFLSVSQDSGISKTRHYMYPYHFCGLLIFKKSGGCFRIPSKISETLACCQVPPFIIFHAVRHTVKLCPKLILKAAEIVIYFIHFLIIFSPRLYLFCGRYQQMPIGQKENMVLFSERKNFMAP